MNYFGEPGRMFETLGLEGMLGTSFAPTMSPLVDVSNGAQDMQASTPGAGGGDWFNVLAGFGNKALDYALLRDQQKLQYSPERLVYAQQVGQIQDQRVQAKESRLGVMLLIGAGLFIAFRSK